MSEKLEEIKGRPHIVAKVVAKPGKAEELERQLKVVQSSALSDAEPGTLSYDILRFGDEFVMLESYENIEAFQFHMTTPIYHAFAPLVPELVAATDFKFYEQVVG